MNHLTIYADMDGWLLNLAHGWCLCGLAPAPIRTWSVMMWRPA